MSTDLVKLSEERESVHGHFDDNAIVMDALIQVATESKNWKTKLSPKQRSSITYLFSKIARILTGDPNYEDHHVDAMNYIRIGFSRKEQDSSDNSTLSPLVKESIYRVSHLKD